MTSGAQILRVVDVCEMLGISRQTLYHLRRDGDFPAAVPLRGRCIGWRLRDVEAWIDARAEQSAATS